MLLHVAVMYKPPESSLQLQSQLPAQPQPLRLENNEFKLHHGQLVVAMFSGLLSLCCHIMLSMELSHPSDSHSAFDHTDCTPAPGNAIIKCNCRWQK